MTKKEKNEQEQMDNIVASMKRKEVVSPTIDTVKIVNELKDFIPRLGEEEKEALKLDIIKDGLIDPLCVYDDGDGFTLIDGHNRISICREELINPKFKVIKSVVDLESAKEWMANHQLNRRNLTAIQLKYYSGRLYKSNVKNKTSNNAVGRSVDSVVDETGLSKRTIQRNAVFTDVVDKIGGLRPDLRSDILNGDLKLTAEQIANCNATVWNTPEDVVIHDLSSNEVKEKKIGFKPSRENKTKLDKFLAIRKDQGNKMTVDYVINMAIEQFLEGDNTLDHV